MSYDDKIMDFIATPENLKIAFEVADFVEKLKERTHQSFWRKFYNNFSEWISESPYEANWRLDFPFLDSYNKNWNECNIKPIMSEKKNKPTLTIGLQQGTSSDNFVLLHGICWKPNIPQEIRSPSFNKLIKLLNDNGLTRSSNNWPAWNYLPYRIRSERFILRMNNEPEIFVEEIRKTYTDLFEKIHSSIELINQDV